MKTLKFFIVSFISVIFMYSCSVDETANSTELSSSETKKTDSFTSNKMSSIVDSYTANMPCFNINFTTTYEISQQPNYDYSVVLNWNVLPAITFTNYNLLYIQIQPLPLGSYPVYNYGIFSNTGGVQITMENATFSPSISNVPYKEFNYRFIYSDFSNPSCSGTSQWYYFNLVQ